MKRYLRRYFRSWRRYFAKNSHHSRPLLDSVGYMSSFTSALFLAWASRKKTKIAAGSVRYTCCERRPRNRPRGHLTKLHTKFGVKILSLADFGFPDIREVCTCGVTVHTTTMLTCVALWIMLAHAGLPWHSLFLHFFFRCFWHWGVCRHSQGRLIHTFAYDGFTFSKFCFDALWRGNKMQSPTVYTRYTYHTWPTRLQSLTSAALSFFTRQSRKVDSYLLLFVLLLDQCSIAEIVTLAHIFYSEHVRLWFYRGATSKLYNELM